MSDVELLLGCAWLADRIGPPWPGWVIRWVVDDDDHQTAERLREAYLAASTGRPEPTTGREVAAIFRAAAEVAGSDQVTLDIPAAQSAAADAEWLPAAVALLGRRP